MTYFKGFASDNNAAVHPDILAAMAQANLGHAVGYGDDTYTREAIALLQNELGSAAHIYFVFIGTAANTLGLKAATQSYQAIICADTAHIQVDECGAPEKFTGCKLLTVPSVNGKITPQLIKRHLHGFGFEHHSQPKVISITQATELGTVYEPQEIRDLATLAHAHNMYLHLDGARIGNAAASLGLSLKQLTVDLGVDILSLGGTKNGMMYGEAVVFFKPELAEGFQYYRKQGMQLASKMRYISAQFTALYSNNLWLNNAKHANEMAQLLAIELKTVPEVEITQPVQTNGVFARIPASIIPKLQAHFFFYVWNEERSEVRWMTSWDTTPEEVYSFVKTLRLLLSQH